MTVIYVPVKKILKRKTKSYTLNKITYCAKKQDCSSCNLRSLCIKPGIDNPRKVTHYDSNYYSKAREWYCSSQGRLLQKLRRVVIEGVIGNAKSYHGMGKAKLRGKEKVQIQFLLTASALNLKKMVKILEINGLKQSFLRIISGVYQFIKNIYVKRLNILVFLKA